ncbi:MAG: 50S ribosomal protein L9 [bacterium ADurb.Bin429]|nr:MAG: 50S ribosomal protein L9 [bacterium ADurb.Bin429]
MKVILTEEVAGLGEPGKIVDVAPGYARNYLVPRKLAVYASKASTREMEHHRQRLERKRQKLVAAARGISERINGQTVTIDAKVGQGGKLFGAVTTSDIADALKAQLDVEIDRRKIHLSEPIHTAGLHSVDVHLMGDSHATLQVQVGNPEDAATAAAPKEAPVEAPVEALAEETAE